MPSDYDNSKRSVGSAYPTDAIDAHPWGRVGPLLTPDELVTRFLFGIPLVSATKDPRNGERMVWTNAMLQDIIVGAVARVEEDGGVDVFPVKRREKHPFDRNLYEAWCYLDLEHRPIISVDKLSVTPSNNVDIYVVPLEWVEAGGFNSGRVNLVPLTIAFTGAGFTPSAESSSGGGAAFLSILGGRGWIPGYWQIEYTSGFEDGRIPRVFNDLIGIYAAIEILAALQATNRNASQSLSIDAMSQSTSTPGPQVYKARLDQLELQRVGLLNKLKARTGRKIIVGTI